MVGAVCCRREAFSNGGFAMKKSLAMGALIALSFAFAHSPVLAMGSGGSTDTSAQKCKKGEVFDKNKKKCVKRWRIWLLKKLWHQAFGTATVMKKIEER